MSGSFSRLIPPTSILQSLSLPSSSHAVPSGMGADGSSIARVLSIPSPNFKGSLIDPPLRASNDITAPSKLARCPIRGGADGSSIARVQRGESATARCASTEDHQAPAPHLFREQEDDQATLPILPRPRVARAQKILRPHALPSNLPRDLPYAKTYDNVRTCIHRKEVLCPHQH